MRTHRLDAVILAGGTAERLGGTSKADLRLGGVRLLDLVLDAIRDLRGGAPGRGVVVAPATVEVPGDAQRTMEEPPGSGPLAGIAAGLSLLPEADRGDLVLVCAVDSPGIGQWAPALLDALDADRPDPADRPGPTGIDGAVAFGGSPDPFRQFLQAVYRRRGLERVLSRAGGLNNRSVRGVLSGLNLLDVPVDAAACRDLDTPEDLVWWRRTREHEV